MKKMMMISLMISAMLCAKITTAQIDLKNIDLRDLIGKVMHVEKGFSPKFSLGKTPINNIPKVAEILGLKKNSEVNKLFNTFRTGRTVYKIGSYAGGAVALYGVYKKIDNSVKSQNYDGLLYTGIGTVGIGVIVKLLTKAASYKAVSIFNDIAVKKIIDIFSIAPASSNPGIGIYVKL
ncbi:MAG: hypothetical protein ABI123_07270 [Ginsengibacter sp.]|jgi:hypothetical protein